MRQFLLFIAFIPTALLAAGWLGAIHPVFDSFAVFRQAFSWLSLLSIVVFLLLKARWAGVATTALCLVSAGIFWPAPPQTDAPYKLYQKNMSFRIETHAPLAQDILETGAQFVTLQEVTARNQTLLDMLADHYESRHFCPFASVGGVAVAATFPAVPGSATCGKGFAALQLETDQGKVWVVSVHLHWPWPHRQHKQVAKILPQIAALSGPKLIGGDFNMVPWAHVMRRFARGTDTTLMCGTYRSFPLSKFYSFPLKYNLPIDHVLLPHAHINHMAELRPLLGSDHRGVLAHFSLQGE